MRRVCASSLTFLCRGIRTFGKKGVEHLVLSRISSHSTSIKDFHDDRRMQNVLKQLLHTCQFIVFLSQQRFQCLSSDSALSRPQPAERKSNTKTNNLTAEDEQPSKEPHKPLPIQQQSCGSFRCAHPLGRCGNFAHALVTATLKFAPRFATFSEAVFGFELASVALATSWQVAWIELKTRTR